jgi:serine/threonine-protein kinase
METPVFDEAAKLITGLPDTLISDTDDRGKNPSARRSQTPFDSGSIDDARFIPGDVLADRYRIVGLLGRGGMGEVYRADDLRLKQPVALKFLPDGLSADGASLARFYREVSVARQISHRHVCRVYDVGEYEGQHFISMEYVRGEELGSLLKRIGRLPQDKAVEIARQLAAGLAAVHEQGVLHRDLKPANIMVDERGEVRVTDFGIAALAEEVSGREAMAGTPAYMSPEQLEGRAATTRSDIYSLGVVLYEIFTGKRAFAADSLPELLSLRRSDTQPSSPSELVAGLDPLIERVIFRCLERDPDKRPATALKVAAALPGGDPLAAALAAGETPSPEMVAAAPKEGMLRPKVAVSLLASVLVLTGFVCFLSGGVGLFTQVPLDKSPEVLRDRASEIMKRLGYVDRPGDSAYGMGLDRGYLSYVRDTDASLSRWERLKSGRPASIYFWYRQSPRPFDMEGDRGVGENTPSMDMPGMMTATLDTLGRLRSFSAVPSQKNSAEAETGAPDWSILFAEAGLDPARFQEVAPAWTPPRPYTARAAWEGSYPEQPGLKMRVEAGAFEGRPVFFELIDAWDRPAEQRPYLGSARERALFVLLLTIFITVLVGGALLAWRNLRLGRGDRRGAARIGVFFLVLFFLHWLFAEHHVAAEEEAVNFIWRARSIVFWAAFFWMVYLAFEPFVRRRWPGRIISWTRLLAGGWRDPLVGRDVLVGMVFGSIVLSIVYVSDLLPRWLGYPPGVPWFDFPATQLLGVRSFANGLTLQIFAAVQQTFLLLFFLFALRVILRRDWLAALAAGLIGSIALSLALGSLFRVPFAFLVAFLMVTCLYRYGLLAAVSASFFLHLNIFYPITSQFSAWYAGDFLLALAVTLGLAAWGFYTSLAGQPLFRGNILED